MTVPDGSITTEKIADGAIDGTKLGTSFGQSGVGLDNIILKDAREITEVDFASSGDVDWTMLDLTQYTSPTAVGAILELDLKDTNGAEARMEVRKPGASDKMGLVVTQAPSVWSIAFVFCAMDEDQRIEYSIDASGTDTAMGKISVIGYIEPAHIP